MIKKILIANRGEIAIRIAKTCKKKGIKTVGIYSEQDKESLHLNYCDYIFSLGNDPLKGSYLNIDKIIDIAHKTKADAVHPGYGFLSENYEFAKKLEKKKILFIGPPHKAIKAMGDKIESKKIAKNAGVNCIPGINKEIKNIKEAIKLSSNIGFPIMIKASAGGGGKGMRIAYDKKDLESLIKLAKEEAKNAFGDDRIFLEKYIELPRHIEIQILGDIYGNIIWLGERECSIQRRHQKIIEEAPSPFLDDRTRKEMGKQAVLLAKAVGYYSAGTVEFIVDKNKNFYFLEMNTRLQVEHPITEETSGLDLVEEMINIANKRKIRIKQDQIKVEGWAFESRLCAENPLENFLPSAGKISNFSIYSEEVRLDSGYVAGNTVSIYYDSLMAKIISKGKNREEARKKMLIALENSDVRGIQTNLDFLINIYSDKTFISGNINTNFINLKYKNGYKGNKSSNEDKLIMSLFALSDKLNYLLSIVKDTNSITSKWYACLNKKNYFFEVLEINILHIKIIYKKQIFIIQSLSSSSYFIKKNIINDEKEVAKVFKSHDKYKIFYKGNFEEINILKSISFDLIKKLPKKKSLDVSKELKSPMPGKVIEIKVKKGDKVVAGEAIIILDAMKMQNILQSEKKGKIKDILVKEGQSVLYNQPLIVIE